MNEELQKRLVESIDKIVAFIERAGGFAIDQAPLVAQELLKRDAFYAWLVVISMVVIIVLCAGVAIYDTVVTHDGDPTFYATLVAIIPCVALFINVHTLVSIHLAPRVYLIENLAALVK